MRFVSKEIVEVIQRLAPWQGRERCGVVLKDNSIVEITNVAKNPNCFIFDKRQWLNLEKSHIQYIWHTHPDSEKPIMPSPTDWDMVKRLKLSSIIVNATGAAEITREAENEKFPPFPICGRSQ